MLLPSGSTHRRPGLLHTASLFLVLIALLVLARTAQAQTLVQTDIPGPSGSGAFGVQVVVLPNGNFVVTDPGFNSNVGAVDLYDGATLARISRLTGSAAGNQVGFGGVTVLANGHYVILSPAWDNGGVADVGAVTWGSSTSGVSGVVSPANSLIGSTAGDLVGEYVVALTNGNYVVPSRLWDNGASADAGAVTWGNGTGGIKGTVSAAISLVGSAPQDQVGLNVTPLPNGNYVVLSPNWDWSPIQNAGAVTWGSGVTGIKGTIDSTNSLVGNDTDMVVGNRGVTVLTNSNYVVNSLYSTSGIPNRGAVTWGSGTTGVTGVVSNLNSLVGAWENAAVGRGGVVALANGHYVVVSPEWGDAFGFGDPNRGAVTWGNGTTGSSGEVGPDNSLVGSQSGDRIGSGGVTALTNGNYVVASPAWSNGAVLAAGAATWVSGAGSASAVVSAGNSLVGDATDDQVSSGGVTPLANGNYVVRSPAWSNGAVLAAGAATWANG
ncbi:MAG: HYR domain-containing protein, partial [Caldilineaceae bacterium]